MLLIVLFCVFVCVCVVIYICIDYTIFSYGCYVFVADGIDYVLLLLLFWFCLFVLSLLDGC